MNATWNLKGDWRSNPASLEGRLDTSSGSWELSGLSLAIGANRVEGSGTWGELLRGDLALNLPEPEIVLPGLTGNLEATLMAEGTPEQSARSSHDPMNQPFSSRLPQTSSQA